VSMTEGTVPWPDELALQYARAGWWRGRDLGAEFADVAAARPEATALVDGTTRISYGSLLARADALASRLARLGLRPGMRIVVQLPNGWPFVVLTLACLRAGIVPVMALPAHRRHELAYLCEHSGARALAVPDVLRPSTTSRWRKNSWPARPPWSTSWSSEILQVGGENLLYRMPGIAQVAVVAAPDAELGERICVFVVPEPGRDVVLSTIRDGMAAAGVAKFKWPERLEVVAELPVTKMGKLDKKALRDMLAGRSTP
jgi:non-ribosomal peptide synthetase component E (peptide arylation enzyme)